MRASDNEVIETLNLLYRIKNLIREDFKHIEEHLSEEFKQSLYNELENFTFEENKRGI